jgi:hypothetical protein
VSSDSWSWTQTCGEGGFRLMNYPHEKMNWATVSTKGATSWIHTDTEGFGTSTQLLTGEKLWIAFGPDRNRTPGDTKGDLGATSWAPPLNDYQDHKLRGYLTAEAILLRPTDVM